MNLAKIKDISTKITKGTTPTTLGKKFVAEGINFIKAEALNGSSELFSESFAFIDEETNTLLKRSIIKENDVLVTIAGINVGKSGIVKKKHLPANTNQAVAIIRPDTNKVSPYFLYYYLKTPTMFRKMQLANGQAAQPNINLETLGNIVINLPRLEDQINISSIISRYDDLIENNEKRIRILEEMSQRLYTEWFVKFKFPGHEKVKIKNGIPENWMMGKLGEKIVIRKGKNITKRTITLGDVPVIAGGMEPAYYHNQSNASAPVITISASGANAGFINLYYQNIWVSDCSYINNDVTPFVFYYYLLIKNNKLEIDNLQRGAAQPHVYPKDLMSLKILKTPDNLANEFEILVTPHFNLITTLSAKNLNLIKTRDLLIPQLVTGRRELKN